MSESCFEKKEKKKVNSYLAIRHISMNPICSPLFSEVQGVRNLSADLTDLRPAKMYSVNVHTVCNSLSFLAVIATIALEGTRVKASFRVAALLGVG